MRVQCAIGTAAETEAVLTMTWGFGILGVLLSWRRKWGEKLCRQGVTVIADDRLLEQRVASQANLDQFNYLSDLLFSARGVVNHLPLSSVQ